MARDDLTCWSVFCHVGGMTYLFIFRNINDHIYIYICIMYITHSFFQQSELSFDIFKVVHHMLPHSSLPGACCSFSTQPQLPEASLLQAFIISSKHLHQSWCQEDYDSVCPGPVGLGLEAFKFRPLHRASGRNDPSSSPFRQLLATCHWVTPAQQVASPEGPLVGSQPPVAWNWDEEIDPEINQHKRGKIHGLPGNMNPYLNILNGA